MFGSFTYIIWLVLFIGLPLLILAAVARQALWRRRRALAWTLLGAFVGGWAWDALAVRLGAWFFDSNKVLGLWLLIYMPVEDLLGMAAAACAVLLFGYGPRRWV